MYNEIAKRITERFTYIENRFEETLPGDFENGEYDELTSEIYSLEEELDSLLVECQEGYWRFKFISLKNRIEEFMQENEFYNPEEMLDMMFPNRQDDDFDEDDDDFSAEDFFDHD